MAEYLERWDIRSVLAEILYRNVPGNFDQKLFESGDRIFQIENEYGKRSRFRLRSGSGGPDR